MSLLLKDRWKDWARQWGLTHFPQQGWLSRTEHVVGERNGLLVRVGWGTDRSASLITCIRFPRAADLERLRQQLAADAALDELPGKGGARRHMAIEDGVKKPVRFGAIPEFTLAPTSLTWRRVFPWALPKTERVSAWVDALVAAVARATPVFDGRCETCATGVAKRHVLVDGMPMRMCSDCQQRANAAGDMAERTYDMTEANHVVGSGLSAFAAVTGAAAWAAVGALTHREFAAAAIGIGALVAWAYRRGAGRVDAIGRVVSAAFTLGSVVLGEILMYAWWVAKARPDIGFRIDAGCYVYLTSWKTEPGGCVITLLFGALGAWVASKALERPKLRQRIEPAEGSATEERRAA